MSQFLSRFLAVGLLLSGLTAFTFADDKKPDDKKPDDKKPDAKKPSSDKPIDWTAFASAGEVSGEIVKADEEGFTIRVSWLVPGKGGASGRARQFRPGKATEKHSDYRLTYAESGLVRWKTLPPKEPGEKGKSAPYTEKERNELRKPKGSPGFAAEHADLKPGHLVEVTLVRPKEISAEKAALQDLRVKYVVIVGSSPNGPPGKR